VHGDGWHDLEAVSDGRLGPDPMDAIAACDDLHALDAGLAGRSPDGPLGSAPLGPPVPRPRNVFAIGLNYRDHVAESKREVPSVPVVFTKFPSCIVGPFDDVELRSASADYEAELVVVVGRGGRDIPPGEAWGRLAGLTAGQDVSDRALQFAATPPHFDLGKSRDTYGPIGPVLVSPDAVADPAALAISCDVNGERRQQDTSASMIFDVPSLVSYLSGIVTLGPGDLVFTGTPEGVGAAKGRFLADGDVVTTSIEGIGTMRNTCRAGR
jgi:2-keto-4-pentenoate hydratase/2-oxohepta-3-ene-1,7-dioic acid hydratase in catechol pathway